MRYSADCHSAADASDMPYSSGHSALSGVEEKLHILQNINKKHVNAHAECPTPRSFRRNMIRKRKTRGKNNHSITMQQLTLPLFARA
jgi:hypothetical protein